MQLKEKGKQGEALVRQLYEQEGYCCVDQNFTFPWGEIDLIMERDDELVFVEVKVVDYLENWDFCLSLRKRAVLERSIDNYCYRKDISKEIRLDVAIVQKGTCIARYINVTNS